MTITKAHVAALTNNLRGFGYDVTQEFVQAEVDALLRGEKPKNIIGMMAETQLKQDGLLP